MGVYPLSHEPPRGLYNKKLILLTVSAMSSFVFSSASFAQTASTAAPAASTAQPAPSKKARAATKAKATPKPATPATPAAAPNNARATIAEAKSIKAPEPEQENVTVVGSLFRDPNLKSMSPITRISRQDMQRRGFANVTDALQSLSSNGSGTLTNSFSANGAFASGASAPSLRGLSTDSTLVLMDGMRLSYYPLSDDGERNFVDTN